MSRSTDDVERRIRAALAVVAELPRGTVEGPLGGPEPGRRRFRPPRAAARVAGAAVLAGAIAVASLAVVDAGHQGSSKAQTASPPTTASRPTTAFPPTTVQLERPAGPLGFNEEALAAGTSIYVLGWSASCQCTAMDRLPAGSRTYERVALPHLDNVPDVVFPTATTGYLSLTLTGTARRPAAAWVTTDGARTWAAIALAPSTGIVAMAATPTALYLVTDHCQHEGDCSCLPQCRLLEVPAGATTGASVALPGIDPAGVQTSDNGLSAYDVAIAATGTHVWVFESGTRHREIVSDDAGRTFTTVGAAPALPRACTYQASTASVLWATCPEGSAVDEYRSDDGGRTFTPVPSPPAPEGYGTGWDVVNATTVYTSTGLPDHNVLRRSTDAGATYTTIADPTADVSCSLTFTTTTSGMALCYLGPHENALAYTTTDGGTTWTRTPPP